MVRIALVALFSLILGSNAAPAARPNPTRPHRAPVTILISIDGFRADYLARNLTPRLSALAAHGLTAAMRPSFPSKTFPNHWTLVTGLVPDHHGIVANKMEDTARPGEKFDMENDDPFWWNAATPVWVDAEKAGIRSATMFWPGANVAIGGAKVKHEEHKVIEGGVRPEDWHQFNQALTGPQRVLGVLDWMRRPAAIRPRFVTLYFDTVDTAGHDGGPNGAEVATALADIDVSIGELVDGLAELGQPANLVIVADHGMAETRDTRTILAETLADPADYRLFEHGPYASFYPVADREAALEGALLRPHPHARCWRRGQIPARFRYGTNPRIPPYVCLADVGWMIEDKAPERPFVHGEHGYDTAAPEMAALFIANGPAFPRGRRLAAFDNVDIAPLVRDLIGLPAKPGDGDDAPFRGLVTPGHMSVTPAKISVTPAKAGAS